MLLSWWRPIYVQSRWRAYCSSEGGVSMGFSNEALESPGSLTRQAASRLELVGV
jgi:hypothetical protein